MVLIQARELTLLFSGQLIDDRAKYSFSKLIKTTCFDVLFHQTTRQWS